MRVVVDGIEYPSKEELRREVKRRLSLLVTEREVMEGHKSFGFLLDLVKRHPKYEEKTRGGILGFYVGVNPWSPGYTLDIIGFYGKKVDISWRTCITGKDTTPMANLLDAMREAITAQVFSFRDTIIYPYSCPKCGQPVSCIEEINVHHLTPFRKLADDFLSSTCLPSPTTFDDGKNNRACFKGKDKDFADDWRMYHEWTAELEALCALCHIRVTAEEAKG